LKPTARAFFLSLIANPTDVIEGAEKYIWEFPGTVSTPAESVQLLLADQDLLLHGKAVHAIACRVFGRHLGQSDVFGNRAVIADVNVLGLKGAASLGRCGGVIAAVLDFGRVNLGDDHIAPTAPVIPRIDHYMLGAEVAAVMSPLGVAPMARLLSIVAPAKAGALTP
jgi:hypothetical protein